MYYLHYISYPVTVLFCFFACFCAILCIQGTGNMLLDMEQQLQANGIRIKVLEQENATLHTSLEKLQQKAQGISSG